MVIMSEVEAFIDLAHKDQFRNDGVTPYSLHPRAVLKRALELFLPTDEFIVTDPEWQCACLCHDVDEDCRNNGFTLSLIELKYGARVRDYAYWVTKPELPLEIKRMDEKERRAARLVWNQEHYRECARHGPRGSHLIKIPDRDINIDDLNDPANRPEFREYYITDTKNLIYEFRAAKIAGVEFLEAHLNRLLGA